MLAMGQVRPAVASVLRPGVKPCVRRKRSLSGAPICPSNSMLAGALAATALHQLRLSDGFLRGQILHVGALCVNCIGTLLAEAVRFELTKGCPLPVFKTGALSRSATPPT